MKPKISVLVSARKNSKYLAKFLFGYFERTTDHENTEILVMMNKGDTWNDELVDFYSRWPYEVKFFYEDHKLGRAGLHVYFNDLLPHATGDWIIYFCEDHFIIVDGWDNYMRFGIKERKLKPKEISVIVPVFDNAGTMNHMVSRGWVEALGDIGKHGWIDSYINGVLYRMFMERANARLIKNMDMPLFHDFTHDNPNPMSDATMQSVDTEKAAKLPRFDTDEVREIIEKDAQALKKAMEAEK